MFYAGRVGHIRHTPFRHKFDYRIYMLAVDVDRIDEVAASSKLFSHNRAGLISLHDKDHGFRDGRSLRAYAESALAGQGWQEFGSRILFVTMPRLLGYAFNPISFYFCHDAAGRLPGQRAPRSRAPGRAPVSLPSAKVVMPDLMVST